MSRINYDLSRIKAFAFDVDGVLSPSTIPLSESGMPMRMVNIKDGYALQLAIKHGYHIAIITGADSPAIRVRFESLGITDIYLKAAQKITILREWMAQNGLQSDEVIYVGDDIPDIEAMLAVGLAVAPSDASDDVKEIAGYISPIAGGYGVGRDVIEHVMRIKGDWMSSSKAFGW